MKLERAITRKSLSGLVFVTVLAIACSCNAFPVAAAAPTIKSDVIVFANGRQLPYEQRRVLHEDPNDALKAGEPVSIEQRPVLVDSWKRLILVTTENLFEDGMTELVVYDYEGNPLGKRWRFVGEAIVLERVGKVLLAQQSSHQFIGESILIGKDGELVARLPQPRDVFRISVSDDQEIIWILSSTYSNDLPATQVDAFANNGEKVRSMLAMHEGEVTMEYKGREYRLAVKEPDFPG